MCLLVQNKIVVETKKLRDQLQQRGFGERAKGEFVLSLYEALYLLENDIDECYIDLLNIFIEFNDFPENVQSVMISMRFQLGPNGFRKFEKMITAIKINNLEKAITEMKDSFWYKQTTNRANELIEILKST